MPVKRRGPEFDKDVYERAAREDLTDPELRKPAKNCPVNVHEFHVDLRLRLVTRYRPKEA
jgi:hypothetical protein